MRDDIRKPGRLIYMMGPSGAGKDSLIDAARAALMALDCRVARRVITRSAESVGEDAQGVSAAEFQHLAAQGAFALSWRANGLDYAIPVQIDEWLADGWHVLINGSRGHLKQARERYPGLLPILVTVDIAVLRQRLTRRGRESVQDIEARLQRNELFDGDTGSEEGRVMRLDNSGQLSDTVSQLLKLLENEGVSAKPDRT